MKYTVHEILQVRILEWVAVPFSRGSSQSSDQTQVSHIVGRFFTIQATREAHLKVRALLLLIYSFHFSSVQSPSHVRLFETP